MKVKINDLYISLNNILILIFLAYNTSSGNISQQTNEYNKNKSTKVTVSIDEFKKNNYPHSEELFKVTVF